MSAARLALGGIRRRHAAGAVLLILAGLASAQEAYQVHWGEGATLGSHQRWAVPQNEYWLCAWLEAGTAAAPLRLYNVEFDWDASRLVPVGDPQPGTLFAGQPDSWFAHYDEGGTRVVTQTLLGPTAGVVPSGPTLLFRQLFHAVGTLDGPAAIEFVSLALRGPANEERAATRGDDVLLQVDLTPPQDHSFQLEALLPAGNTEWTSQPAVTCRIEGGDGSLAATLLRQEDGAPENEDTGWEAPPPPTGFTLAGADGWKTVHAWLRDAFGNQIELRDSLRLDRLAPLYHVTDFQADPRHHGALLSWRNPQAADFDRVRVYRHGWCDDGLSRYPEYDDLAPMSGWPDSEAEALAAGFQPVYEGSGESFTDLRAPRDAQRYAAFCVDHAGNVGPGDSAARDRCTNYLLGDVRSPWDGVAYTQDLVLLSLAYSSVPGQPHWNAQLDYGPTDDRSGSGIPLTDNRIDFEDLMVFAMNYGPYGPLLLGGTASSGSPGTGRLALEPQGGELRIRLEDAPDWLGLHLELAWDGTACPGQPLLRGAGTWLATPTLSGMVLDGLRLDGESADGCLATLEFGTTGVPAGLRLVGAELRDRANQPLQLVQDGQSRPGAFGLEGNHPNPFNPSTTLVWRLEEEGPARLSIHNCLGQRVAVLVDGPMEAGRHATVWEAGGLASGVYLARLETAGRVDQRKLILLR